MHYLQSRSIKWLVVSAMLAGLLAGVSKVSAAPTAAVSAIVLDVSYQTDAGRPWTRAKIGTQLPAGSRVRTGRRSKCEVKFPCGSIARLAPRSELLLSSVTDAGDKVKLMSGQVLVNVIKGYRMDIEGAKATVAVQGTWVLFDGETPTVWKGTAMIQTPAGDASVGDQRTARYGKTSVPLMDADGKPIGTVTVAVEGENMVATYDTESGISLGVVDLYVGPQPPKDSAFATVQRVKRTLTGAARNQYVIPLSEVKSMGAGGLYLAVHAFLRKAGKRDAGDAWGKGILIGNGPGMYFAFNPVITEQSYPFEFPTGSAQAWWADIKPGVSTQSTPGTAIGQQIKQVLLSSPVALNRSFSRPAGLGSGAADVGARGFAGPRGVSGALAPLQLLAAGLAASLNADEQSPEARFGKQSFASNSQFDFSGLVGTGGESFSSLRARMSVIVSDAYIEIGELVSTGFDGNVTNQVSEAFVTWKEAGTHITAGRQHCLESVANNSVLGTLFPTYTFDGFGVHQEIGKGYLDVTWVDSFPDGFVRPDKGGGWLGRLRFPIGLGQIGAMAFGQRLADSGHSYDFTYPVKPGLLDIYGEFGKDPLGHSLSTYGAYFPKLFQRYGVDLFVEHAQREGFPSLWSALGYVDMNRGWTGVAGLGVSEDNNGLQFQIGFIKRYGALRK